MIEEKIHIECTSQGHPYFPPDKNLRVKLHVNGSELEILGDSASLRRLGEIFIGLSKSKDFHLHLSADAHSPVLVDPHEFQLVLSNTDQREHSADRITRPPDWASG